MRPQMPFHDFSRFFHDSCVKREKTGGYKRIRKGTVLRLKMVHPARFELTTYCSGGNRSIQLSYGCTKVMSGNIQPDRGKSNRFSFRKGLFCEKRISTEGNEGNGRIEAGPRRRDRHPSSCAGRRHEGHCGSLRDPGFQNWISSIRWHVKDSAVRRIRPFS